MTGPVEISLGPNQLLDPELGRALLDQGLTPILPLLRRFAFAETLKGQERKRYMRITQGRRWERDIDLRDCLDGGEVVCPPKTVRRNADGSFELKQLAPLTEAWRGILFLKDGSSWAAHVIPLIGWLQHGHGDDQELTFEEFRSPLEPNPSKLYGPPGLPWSPGGRWLCVESGRVCSGLLAPDGRVMAGHAGVLFAGIEAYAASHKMKQVEVVTHG